MALLLPPRLNTERSRLCVAVANALRDAVEEVVEVDASQLVFIDPFALSMLSSACASLGQRGQVVDVVALHPTRGGYLERMDLFRQPWMRCGAQLARGREDRRGSMLELKRLHGEGEVDVIAGALATAILGSVPGIAVEAARDEMTGRNPWDHLHEPLGYVLTELLQNGVTHARRHGFAGSSLWVSAQYFADGDFIDIGIVDDGCGFLTSLRNHSRLEAQTHQAAIALALEPRVSCNRDVGLMADAVNAGVGLTTAYRIARQAGGRMLIVSGDSHYWPTADEVRRDRVMAQQWQGAALSLRLPRRLLAVVDFRELLPLREIGREAPPIRFS